MSPTAGSPRWLARLTLACTIALSGVGGVASCGSSTDEDLFDGEGDTPPPTTEPDAAAPAPEAGNPIQVECIDPTTCPHSAGQNPCCTRDYKCGVFFGQTPDVRCFSLNQPGTPDQTCARIFVLQGNAPGCCRPDGTCGFEPTVAPEAGCIAPQQVGEPVVNCGESP